MTDPRFERALEEFLEAQRLSRRRFLGRAGGAALAATGLSTLLAACGGVEGTQQKAAEPSKKAAAVSHPKTTIGDWTFSNWPLYIDKKVLKDFDKKYGGNVKYVEEINDNYEFFGKVRQQLENGQPIGRDIVVLTDYMASRWSATATSSRSTRRTSRTRRTSSTTSRRSTTTPTASTRCRGSPAPSGIGYNIKKTGRELKSVKDLFDPKFKGRVTMLSEPYDSASTVLLGDGVDASKATIDQILGAIEKIDKANKGGQFRRFTGNDYTTDLAKGNVWVSLAYSGDMVQLQSDNPDLRFAYPEEGTMLFTDNMMMPAKVEHPYAAETMMNYVYDPEVAAKIARTSTTSRRSRAPRRCSQKTDPKLANNQLIFPPPTIAGKIHPYPALSPADERADAGGDGEGDRRLADAAPLAAAAPAAAALALPGAGPAVADGVLRDPAGQPAQRLAADRRPRDRATSSTGTFSTYTDAISRLQRAVPALDRLRGGGDGPVLRDRVPAGVLHRVQGGAVEELHAAADHPAVLRLATCCGRCSWQLILADDGWVVDTLQDDRAASATTGGCWPRARR